MVGRDTLTELWWPSHRLNFLCPQMITYLFRPIQSSGFQNQLGNKVHFSYILNQTNVFKTFYSKQAT